MPAAGPGAVPPTAAASASGNGRPATPASGTAASPTPLAAGPTPQGPTPTPGRATPLPATAATPVALRLVTVARGFEAPLFLAVAPDASGRLFVLEQSGRIMVAGADGGTAADPFLDIRDRVSQDGGERGLLGLAFHPAYATNGRFFVYYVDQAARIVVAEFHRRDATHADGGSERVLLRIDHSQYPNHNGGMIAFGPDGMLYIGTGDGGGAGDPLGNGQNPGTLLAKLLRIDVDGAAPYAVPSDNPFVGRSRFRPEVWAYGLRNPWRFSFDRVTGALYVGDVGQNLWEEIDVAPRGAGGQNYGWHVMEGRHCYQPAVGCSRAGITLPVAEYGHDQGCAVMGGYVYRGPSVPSLDGWYLFGDYCTGRIWGIRADAALRGPATPRLLLQTGMQIRAFGQDGRGEVYVVGGSGDIYRLAAGG
jgi:glucose/arabinose dehydrogenase